MIPAWWLLLMPAASAALGYALAGPSAKERETRRLAEEALEAYTGRCARLEAEAARCNDALRQKSQDYDAFSEKMRALTQRVQSFETAHMALQTELTQSRAECQALSHSMAVKQDAIELGEVHLGNAQMQNTELRSQVRALNRQLKAFDDARGSLLAKMEQTHRQCEALEEAMHRLQRDVASRGTELKRANAENAALRASIEIHAQQTVSPAEWTRALSQCDALEANMHQLQRTVDARGTELAAARAECDALRQQMRALEANVQMRHATRPNANMVAIMKERDALRAERGNANAQSEAAIQERDALRVKLQQREALDADLSDLRQKTIRQADDILKARREYETLLQTKRQIQAAYDALHHKHDERNRVEAVVALGPEHYGSTKRRRDR